MIYAYLFCATTNICVEIKYGHLGETCPTPSFFSPTKAAMWSASGIYVGIIQMSSSSNSSSLGPESSKKRVTESAALVHMAHFYIPQPHSRWSCGGVATSVLLSYPNDFPFAYQLLILFCPFIAISSHRSQSIFQILIEQRRIPGR